MFFADLFMGLCFHALDPGLRSPRRKREIGSLSPAWRSPKDPRTHASGGLFSFAVGQRWFLQDAEP